MIKIGFVTSLHYLVEVIKRNKSEITLSLAVDSHKVLNVVNECYDETGDHKNQKGCDSRRTFKTYAYKNEKAKEI